MKQPPSERASELYRVAADACSSQSSTWLEHVLYASGIGVRRLRCQRSDKFLRPPLSWTKRLRITWKHKGYSPRADADAVAAAAAAAAAGPGGESLF